LSGWQVTANLVVITALGYVVVVIVVAQAVAAVVVVIAAAVAAVVVAQGGGQSLGVGITTIDIRQATNLQQVRGLQEVGQLFVAHIYLTIVHKAEKVNKLNNKLNKS